MNDKTRVIFSWSSGKDSAYALHQLLNDPSCEVVSLITSITSGYDRISMHGIRTKLLEEQAKQIGLPLYKIPIPKNCSNEDYEKAMEKAMTHFLEQGIKTVAFGDIFLKDVKEYRIKQLAKVGMNAIFPLWGKNTKKLSHDFIKAGFKSIISCIDTRKMDQSFSGRIYNKLFLNDLPNDCDPCGENGEFHSFVFDGPFFKAPIQINTGFQTLKNNYFYFTEILPKNEQSFK